MQVVDLILGLALALFAGCSALLLNRAVADRFGFNGPPKQGAPSGAYALLVLLTAGALRLISHGVGL